MLLSPLQYFSNFSKSHTNWYLVAIGDGDSFRPCLYGGRVKINSARRRTLLRASKDIQPPPLHLECYPYSYLDQRAQPREAILTEWHECESNPIVENLTLSGGQPYLGLLHGKKVNPPRSVALPSRQGDLRLRVTLADV